MQNPEIVEEPVDPLTNVEAEQCVIGALLTNNSNFINIGALQPKHFSDSTNREIFIEMQKLWGLGVSFNPITMPFERKDYLRALAISSIGAIRIAEYSQLLIDLAQRREIREVCEEGKKSIAEEKGGLAVERAMVISEKLIAAVEQMEESVFADDFEVTEQILNEMKRDVQPYSTGYSALDIAMAGGLYPGKSYGFAARKKMGKTILAGSISCNLNLQGLRHLFICGEMSPAEIQKRTLARLLKVKQAIFNSKEGRQTAFMERVVKVADASRRSMIYKNAPGLTFDELKRYVLLARMQKKISGFILDYWQLVGGKPKGKSTAEHLDEVAQWIADTCRKYDLWSITMAQINQEGNTRGGEGIRLAFDQVYTLQAPKDDPGRSERWLDMADTRYTPWRSVGTENRPGLYLNELGPYFSETLDDALDL